MTNSRKKRRTSPVLGVRMDKADLVRLAKLAQRTGAKPSTLARNILLKTLDGQKQRSSYDWVQLTEQDRKRLAAFDELARRCPRVLAALLDFAAVALESPALADEIVKLARVFGAASAVLSGQKARPKARAKARSKRAL